MIHELGSGNTVGNITQAISTISKKNAPAATSGRLRGPLKGRYRCVPPPLIVGSATLGWRPGLTRRQNFSVIRDARQAGDVLARLLCVRCRVDTKSVLRCRRCGALCSTSEIGSAMLTPSAFALYGLISVVAAIFWFA